MTRPDSYALGLTGWPLGHSLSPQLQRAALEDCGLSGSYVLLPVPPLPDGSAGLADLAARLRAGNLHGLNVTIPHKQAFAALADRLTPAAQAIGAANTYYMQDGELLGDNTDIPGLLADLRAQFGQRLPAAGRALLLGAGGSARAAAYALAQQGWQVSVAARRVHQARELCAALSGGLPAGVLTPLPLQAEALQSAAGVDLLVNSTPLGMFPHTETCPWPEDLPLPAGAAVYDLVYNPRETLLVHRARAAGLPAATGLGMLVEQAALAFERWTGCSPARAAMVKYI